MSRRLPTRIFFGCGALLLGIAWLVAVNLSLDHQRNVSSEAFRQSRTGLVMLTAMLDQETGLRGYQASGDDLYLQPYTAGRANFDKAQKRARASASGARSLTISLDEQATLASQWQELAGRVIAQRQVGRGKSDIPQNVELKGLMDRFRTANANLQSLLIARREQGVANASRQTLALVIGMSVLVALMAFALLRRAAHIEVRYRRSQEEFADAMQSARDEPNAHALLKRHLERRMPSTEAHVLNRNNSADRLEATTPVPAESPLVAGLLDAEPSSCVAVHTARPYERAAGTPPLLECAVCGGIPGTVTCQPMVVGGEVIGSVLATQAKALRPTDVRRLSESVAQAAPVLGNLRTLAIAESRAATDALTGLPNRRAIHDALTRMIALAGRNAAPLTAILFDLDHFKRVNDTAGHDKGDEVLAAVSHAITGTVRASDFAGRYGGEEFLVLLPDTDAQGAAKLCEVLRANVAAITVPGVGQPISASFGVAIYPDDAPNGELMLRLADRALYQAKANGRNRVELAAAVKRLAATTPDERPAVTAQ